MCSALIQGHSFTGVRSTVYAATGQVLLEEVYKTIVGHKQENQYYSMNGWVKTTHTHFKSGYLGRVKSLFSTWPKWSAQLMSRLTSCKIITRKSLVNSSTQMNITPTWAWKEWLRVMGSMVRSITQLTLSIVIISEGDAAVWPKQCCDGGWDHLLESPKVRVPWSWITVDDYK